MIGRLAILDKPKIGTVKRRKHDTKEERGTQKVTTNTIKKKPRYAGKLAALFDLPLDIFFEVRLKQFPSYRSLICAIADHLQAEANRYFTSIPCLQAFPLNIHVLELTSYLGGCASQHP
jgi:hypothetical protein